MGETESEGGTNDVTKRVRRAIVTHFVEHVTQTRPYESTRTHTGIEKEIRYSNTRDFRSKTLALQKETRALALDGQNKAVEQRKAREEENNKAE